jgi:hypothetical protein
MSCPVDVWFVRKLKTSTVLASQSTSDSGTHPQAYRIATAFFSHGGLALATTTKDWLRQAEKDLQHVKKFVVGGDFEWGCFAALHCRDIWLVTLFFCR